MGIRVCVTNLTIVLYRGRWTHIKSSRTRCSMHMDEYQTELSPLFDAFGSVSWLGVYQSLHDTSVRSESSLNKESYRGNPSEMNRWKIEDDLVQ